MYTENINLPLATMRNKRMKILVGDSKYVLDLRTEKDDRITLIRKHIEKKYYGLIFTSLIDAYMLGFAELKIMGEREITANTKYKARRNQAIYFRIFTTNMSKAVVLNNHNYLS